MFLCSFVLCLRCFAVFPFSKVFISCKERLIEKMAFSTSSIKTSATNNNNNGEYVYLNALCSCGVASVVSLYSCYYYYYSRYKCKRFAKEEETVGTQKKCLFSRRSYSKEKDSSDKEKKVMLVISHPDDEAMFFGPTLESLKKTKNVITTTKVFCICLSNGNASGLGQTRAKELKKSTLEVFKLDGCVIAESEDLQDGIENAWPLEEIANVVHECVQHYSPDVILTFDERGVSKHPNHVQTHRGVMRFIVEAKLGAIPNAEYTEENVPEVWVLETTPFYRTFMGAMDYWASVITTTTRKKKGSKNTSNESSNSNSSSLAAGASSTSSSSVMFCSRNPSLVLEAMRTHATQWVWYRKLYVAFSRYSLLNTLRRMDVGPPPSQQEK